MPELPGAFPDESKLIASKVWKWLYELKIRTDLAPMQRAAIVRGYLTIAGGSLVLQRWQSRTPNSVLAGQPLGASMVEAYPHEVIVEAVNYYEDEYGDDAPTQLFEVIRPDPADDILTVEIFNTLFEYIMDQFALRGFDEAVADVRNQATQYF